MSLAVSMLAGCSEERLPEQTKENPTNPEAPTPSSTSNAAKDATILYGTLAAGSSEGWFENDSLWIFTLHSMKHNSYLLSQGVGSADGTFRRTSGTDNYEDSNATLYALTSPKYLYGFSAAEKSFAQRGY